MTIIYIIAFLVIVGGIYNAYTKSYFYRNSFLNAVRLEMLPCLNRGFHQASRSVEFLYKWADASANNPEFMSNKNLKKVLKSLQEYRREYESFLKYANASNVRNFERHYNIFRMFVEELNRNTRYLSAVCPQCIDDNLLKAQSFLYEPEMLSAIKGLNSRVEKFNTTVNENNLADYLKLKMIELS